MSVPQTPDTPDETLSASSAPNSSEPTSSAPNSNDPAITDAPTQPQPVPPDATPRTTARPQVAAPPNSPTSPPQPATTPAAQTQLPAPARAFTSPPSPQQTHTQPPAQSPEWTQPPKYTAAAPAPEAPPSPAWSLLSKFDSQPRSRFSLWQRVTLLVTGVLLIVALGVGGFGIYATHEAQQPALAAQMFCRDLQTKQYTAAYQMLTSAYQAQTSQAQFVYEAGLHDQVDGPVAACAVLHSSAPTGYTLRLIDSATLVARITRNKAFDGGITVIKEGNAWRVSSIATSLQGTTLAPLLVGTTFCRALVAKDYAAAYSTFSSNERSGGNESAFAATFAKAFGTAVQITGCTPTVPSYVVAPDAHSATVDVALQITLHVQGNGLVTIPATVGFVTEGGTWKVDSIAVKTP